MLPIFGASARQSCSKPRVRASHGSSLSVTAAVAAMLLCSGAYAQTIPLGDATSFSVLGASAITSNGATIVVGDLGIAPNTATSVTGFTFSSPPGPGTVVGTPHFADGPAIAAQNSATVAYGALAGLPCTSIVSADLGGATLAPGVYCSASSIGLTGTLTLDAQGDPDAQFVFQLGSALTTASNASVNIINDGQACNVFWQVGSSATLGTGSSLLGTLIALTSVTLNTGAQVDGRVFARNGAVTIDAGDVNICTLGAASPLPTLSKSFSPISIVAGGLSTLTITLTNTATSPATLTSDFVDVLPSGVVLAANPAATSTCGNALLTATGGAPSVSLLAGSIVPAAGSCQINVAVTAVLVGVYLNVIPIDALVTSNGNNPAPATATLTVIAGTTPTPIPTQPAPNVVPTMSWWSLMLLGAVLALVASRSRLV
jgi:uncharacterized repeat protein (TIGR01451 family)